MLPFVQSPTDLGQQFLRKPRLSVHRRDRQMGLSTMVREFANAREQQWTCRDGFQSGRGVREAHEYTPGAGLGPPVVHQCHRHCTELTALQIVSREPGPAPLVFDFIESVFGIATIPVQLRNYVQLEAQVCHQHRILVAFHRALFPLVDSCYEDVIDDKDGLAAYVKKKFGFKIADQGPTQHHDAPRSASSTTTRAAARAR